MERPMGVGVIALIFSALAMLSLLWSGLVFGLGGLTSFFGGLLGAGGVVAFGTSNTWSGFLGIAAAGLQIAVVAGLMAMKRWAWFLALAGVGLTIVEGFLGIVSGGRVAISCGILGLIVPAGILIYLLRPRIRRAFGIQ
jgi:hypothetical protein